MSPETKPQALARLRRRYATAGREHKAKLSRPFRAWFVWNQCKPGALPWAGIGSGRWPAFSQSRHQSAQDDGRDGRPPAHPAQLPALGLVESQEPERNRQEAQ